MTVHPEVMVAVKNVTIEANRRGKPMLKRDFKDLQLLHIEKVNRRFYGQACKPKDK